jgi:hypothetical protein
MPTANAEPQELCINPWKGVDARVEWSHVGLRTWPPCWGGTELKLLLAMSRAVRHIAGVSCPENECHPWVLHPLGTGSKVLEGLGVGNSHLLEWGRGLKVYLFIHWKLSKRCMTQVLGIGTKQADKGCP